MFSIRMSGVDENRLGGPSKKFGESHQWPKFNMATKMLQKINKIGCFSYSVWCEATSLTKMNPSQNIMMAGDLTGCLNNFGDSPNLVEMHNFS